MSDGSSNIGSRRFSGSKYGSYFFELSHFPKRETWKITTVVPPWYCKRCFTNSSATTQYYIDVGLHGSTSASWCPACHNRFSNVAQLNEPYWIVEPTQRATKNIRTRDDAGIREFEDGTYCDWDELWEDDLTWGT